MIPPEMSWSEDPLPLPARVYVDGPVTAARRPRPMRRPSDWLTSPARTDRVNYILSLVREQKCRCRRRRRPMCAPCQARRLRARDGAATKSKRAKARAA